MNGDPFDHWWFYEMGRMDAESAHEPPQAPTPKQKVVLYIVLTVVWLIATIALSVVIYAFANLFLDWSFWPCLLVSGLISLWICSLCAR